MAYTDGYFTLTWTYSGTPYTRRFRLLQVEANPEGQRNLSGARRDLSGVLNVCRVSFAPKVLEGVVAVHPSETNPYGTLAELKLAWDRAVTDLTCQRWADGSAWSAYWNGDWGPVPADPCGAYWYVPIRLEQIQ